MKTSEVRPYYEALQNRKFSLFTKRLFDIVLSSIFIVCFIWLILILYLIVKIDSPGGAIFKQQRVTKDGKIFEILKFRTMIPGADKKGSGVTIENDPRITRVGKWLRKFRLDEIPQIFNIFKGELSFVGVRPETDKYVQKYTPEMYATLLLPAGVTSLTSILYKDEAELLKNSENPDKTYIEEILPAKMKYNLEYIKKFGFWYDIKIMLKTVIAVIKK